MTIGTTLKNAGIAGLIAAAINAVIYFIAHSQGWLTDAMQIPDKGPVPISGVLMFSVLPALDFLSFAKAWAKATEALVIAGVVAAGA